MDLERDLLGRGGMGAVYRATDTLTGGLVAVKALALKTPEAAARPDLGPVAGCDRGHARPVAGQPDLLRRTGPLVDKLGLYLGSRCTTSAIADSPGTAYRLTRSALAEMKETQPELAATFHEFAARLLSERLAATTQTLSAVLG